MSDKTYKCVASGDTYPVKDSLRSWAFTFNPASKTWHRDCVSENERRRFEGEVENGQWVGVELEFEEETNANT